MKSTKSKKNQYYLFMGIVLLLSTLKFVSPINAAALIAFPDQVDDVYSSADNGYVITHPELDLTGARRTGNEFKIWLNDEVDQSLTGTDKTKITIIFSNTGEDQLLESIDVWIFILTIDTSGIEITLIDPTFQIKTGISSSIDKKIITMTIDTSTIQLTDYAAFYVKCVGTVSNTRYMDWAPDEMSPYSPFVAFSPLPFIVVGIVMAVGISGFFGLRVIQSRDIALNDKFNQLKGKMKLKRNSEKQPSAES